MKIYVTFDMNITRNAILKEQLDKLGVQYSINGAREIVFNEKLTAEQELELAESLNKYGVTIIDNQKTELVQRIKDTINEMLKDDEANLYKISAYLADKLNYSYAYLSNLFSESTYTSIENFVILKKVDHAKELMANTDLTLTEIAYRLKYSSVAHLSGQFKKITGLTPSTFQKIIKKRKIVDFNKL
ncbi:AraC family transcriptional regulator [Aureibaculum sp. 2210JD6-5]|uniref:helix-turn-helix domain-containing protein n=1 Tax=Aureibaculum sp. 2210JD6-5 TaxID=3103957 RepID=UPI002AACED5B|nr:AraC family transcriptional regulator [Aureibaculum sp. 2210JD6-5]MDY7394988.1 AraC family transcriptional regulator [Aureibaculum sp. 2210JD6-5]